MKLLPLVLAALLAGPAAGQDPYGPPDPAKAKPPGETQKCQVPRPGEEIVVCAELEDQEQFRVEGTQTDGTEGAPRAPNMEHDFKHSGMGVVFKGCFIPPCPPPMPKIIDLKAIPEAPAGSDADRAARGLAPTRGGRTEYGSADASGALNVTPPE